MNETDDIKRVILAACEEDHVGLWEVIRIVEREIPDQNAAQVRRLTLDLLQELLSANRIVAGVPAKNGSGFDTWKLPIANIMETIHKEWTVDRRPTIGEVAWFTAIADHRPEAALDEVAAEWFRKYDAEETAK